MGMAGVLIVSGSGPSGKLLVGGRTGIDPEYGQPRKSRARQVIQHAVS
jgi:hypothetical protein